MEIYTLSDALNFTEASQPLNDHSITRKNFKTFELPPTISVFQDRLYRHSAHPKYVKAFFDCLESELVVAGNAVCAAIIDFGKKQHYNFFIVASADPLRLLTKLDRAAGFKFTAYYGNDKNIWTTKFITVCVHKYNFASIQDLLQNFDIDAAAVAFDGKQAYFTRESITAYATGQIKLNLSKRCVYYEQRLAKYFNDYGFDIILNATVKGDCIKLACGLIINVNSKMWISDKPKSQLEISSVKLNNSICHLARGEYIMSYIPTEEEIRKICTRLVKLLTEKKGKLSDLYEYAPKPIQKMVYNAMINGESFDHIIEPLVAWFKDVKIKPAKPAFPFVLQPMTFQEWF
jgi:hypothetical protein